jgi:hypothetical protein
MEILTEGICMKMLPGKNTKRRPETRRQRKKKKKQQRWTMIKLVFNALSYAYQVAKVIEYFLKFF